MDNLTNSLPYVVQYRRKDDGVHWIDMAAFDIEEMATRYCNDCSYNVNMTPWEYRVDDRGEAGRAALESKNA